MKLGYKMHGDGACKVMVLNDWLCDCTSYEPTMPYLNQRDFQFAFTDLRGYGKSKDLAGQYCLDEASQDILDTADCLGWQEFHLIGYSMTGLVGQNVAAAARDRVKSFIGICPVGANGMPGSDDSFFQFMSEAAAGNDENGMQIAQMLTGGRYGNEWAEFKVRRWRETSIAAARINYLDMFVRSNIVDRVKGLSTAILVITTSDDIESLRKPALADTFCQCYSNISFVEIGNSGHSPMIESPVSLATVINRFLQDITNQGSNQSN